jgi:hypothetical protein
MLAGENVDEDELHFADVGAVHRKGTEKLI